MLESETDWIDKFIRHLEYERRLSKLTCKHYRRDLCALSEYCDSIDLHKWDQVDDDHLRSVSASWFRRGLAPRSIQRRLSAIRMFFRFLLREKHVKKNPVQTVRAPKAGKRLPENLDADRMAKLLDIPGEGPLVARDRAVLELLYSSGLRLAELTDLNLGDVDLADCTVRVTGKGNKDRIVPVGRHAITALRQWHTERGLLATPGQPPESTLSPGTG